MRINRRQFILLPVATGCISAHQALADDRRGRRQQFDDDFDYEDADRARRAGDVVPLRNVLKMVRKSFKGEIVGVEFEMEDGLWVYEIKMVDEDDRYVEIYVDAKSNKILKTEGK